MQDKKQTNVTTNRPEAEQPKPPQAETDQREIQDAELEKVSGGAGIVHD
jgi:hypothetical protein